MDATIKLPLSKSISNRALIINALTHDAIPIDKVAHCDDTDVMVKALSSTSDDINIGAAGTAMRFLTAYFACNEGRVVTIDGTERMRKRPIGALVDALRQCGATIEYAAEEGFPPLRISGKHLQGGDIELPASISSQYISALLMIAPVMEQGIRLSLIGNIISHPYILMTLKMMEQWGIESSFEGNLITIAPQSYHPTAFSVEADWSASSYWYEIAALSASEFSLVGLDNPSVQGDSRIAQIFQDLGVITTYDNHSASISPSPDLNSRLTLDMSEQPDLAQTIAVTCCMLGIPFHLTGLSTLKIKETDRLTALVNELAKLSFRLYTESDSKLIWDGSRRLITPDEISIDTYDDHRMAMAFAPCAIYLPGLVINDAQVVSKSYPQYWDDLRSAGFTIVDADQSIEEEPQ